ncbi:eCIS core domain-containing protein [[Clostridium] polysaccharolyticum]|uniref:eCIS core domain-containing protein n=1 Tax=[Clostridium] polysaccharolyticum TaxID=29364 RepID=A0A1I0AI19_9FIRM|nr:DUF4157 domain-containing protein [[Clostridium] polysaccharolyticum]SES93949.1 protein of unknown function [[Clostridium] polysaccharolyticum]
MYQVERKKNLLHHDSSVSGKVSQAAGRTSMVTHQLKASDFRPIENIQRKKNNTGLSDQLKSGIESMSGYSMDDVKVHFNSSKPAMVQAHAYTSGTDIHVAPGQEKHLAHEAWHVVQQKQGRVKPTTTVNGMSVNDNAGLEQEADVMGAKALQCKSAGGELKDGGRGGGVMQRALGMHNDNGLTANKILKNENGFYWVKGVNAALCEGEEACKEKAKEKGGIQGNEHGDAFRTNDKAKVWLYTTKGREKDTFHVGGYVIRHHHDEIAAGYQKSDGLVYDIFNGGTDTFVKYEEPALDEASNKSKGPNKSKPRMQTKYLDDQKFNRKEFDHFHGAGLGYNNLKKTLIEIYGNKDIEEAEFNKDQIKQIKDEINTYKGSTGNHVYEKGILRSKVSE